MRVRVRAGARALVRAGGALAACCVAVTACTVDIRPCLMP